MKYEKTRLDIRAKGKTMTFVLISLANGYQRVDVDPGDCGICAGCGEWTEEELPLDASGRECDKCGQMAVYGTEMAAILGLVSPHDDLDDAHDAAKK